jgi:branched-subunit amino acid ABC-type transport system permease component
VDWDVLIENVMNALAAGVIIGCIYGLMCVGLGLIFGVMKVINFAQGELLMLGMYVSLYLVANPFWVRMSARSLARCWPVRWCLSAACCCIDS